MKELEDQTCCSIPDIFCKKEQEAAVTLSLWFDCLSPLGWRDALGKLENLSPFLCLSLYALLFYFPNSQLMTEEREYIAFLSFHTKLSVI